MKLQCLVLTLISVMVASCAKPIAEPVGEPYKIVVQATQDSTAGKSVNLTALIQSTARGYVFSKVEFIDGTTVLATTTEKTQITPTNDRPWDLKASENTTLNTGKLYNIRAKISWTYKGVAKVIESTPIPFQLSP